MNEYIILDNNKKEIVKCKEANQAVKEVVIFLLDNNYKTIDDINRYSKSLLKKTGELEDQINKSDMDLERKEKALKSLNEKQLIDRINNGSLRYRYLKDDIWLKDGFTYEKINNNFFRELEKDKLINIQSLNSKGIEISLSESKNIGNEKMREQPLNQILYGSPGTGKTYNTINKALEIIFNQNNECSKNNEDKNKKYEVTYKKENCETEIKNVSYQEAIDNKDRTALNHIFEEYKKNGQIEFVTFHQSYGYEEFVEGIKAETKDKNISYEIKPGIFKKLCEIAKDKEYLIEDFSINDDSSIWKISLGSTYENEIKTKCFNDNEIRIGWTDVQKVGDDNFNKLGFNNQSTIKNFIEDMEIGDLVISIYNQNKIDAIGIIESEYKSDEHEHYNKFRKVKWLSKDILDLTQLNGNKVFVQKTVYKIDRFTPKDLLSLIKQNELKVKNDNSSKNYILIIDEVNRGNISKIFGELITLIEPSKRIGANEEIKLKLPYSGDDFGVPQNLYIIGTMNTADRSIAPIDTALRRRFVFEEMAPNPSLLNENIEGVNLQLLLEAINTRIEYLYDRDHTIGHAYLIDVKDLDGLRFAFKNKIIPLLAEYFYEDWENIDLVLNKNGFIQLKKDDNKYLLVVNKKISEKIIYKVGDDNWEIENFKRIYNGHSNPQENNSQIDTKKIDE
jgi:5-methylcytosine-specific restriction protein B